MDRQQISTECTQIIKDCDTIQKGLFNIIASIDADDEVNQLKAIRALSKSIINLLGSNKKLAGHIVQLIGKPEESVEKLMKQYGMGD